MNSIEPTSDESAIRAEIDAWAQAVRHKDVEGVLSHFAPHNVRFDLAPPLETDQPLQENLHSWFATFDGDIGYEVRGLTVTTGGDIAYSHSFNHIFGCKTDGERADVWFRETLCFRKIQGHWRITHSHESVPFLMDGSQRAALDLHPPCFG